MTVNAVRDLIMASYIDLAHPDSVVYWAMNPDTCAMKIGRSRNLSGRIATLRTAIPGLEALGHFPGGAEAEANLHAEFAADRIAGEWFRPTARLILTMADLTRESRRGA